jgi:hypothetical protein
MPEKLMANARTNRKGFLKSLGLVAVAAATRPATRAADRLGVADPRAGSVPGPLAARPAPRAVIRPGVEA